MKITDTPLGTEVLYEEFFIFFGKKDSQILNLKNHYTDLSFQRTKQVHGDTVIIVDKDSQDYSQEADAQITNLPNLALCSISADCVPILILGSRSKTIAAIHAGWRGVANRIFLKTISAILKNNETASSLKIFIGPHILQESFEVESPVENQLRQCIKQELDPESNKKIFLKTSDKKTNICLFSILQLQASEFNISKDQFYFHRKNTKIDQNYHSARRDKELSGRQISFICKI